MLAWLVLAGCAPEPWVVYHSQETGLEARFPVQPREQKHSFPVGGRLCDVTSVVARHDGSEYWVNYFEYPRGLNYDEHQGIQSLARLWKGTVVSESVSSLVTSHSMQPARAFQLTLPDGRFVQGKVAAAWENRQHPHRNYQMLVVRPANTRDKEAKTFLDGLRFLDD